MALASWILLKEMMSRNSPRTMATFSDVTRASLQPHPFRMLCRIKSRFPEHAIESLYPSPPLARTLPLGAVPACCARWWHRGYSGWRRRCRRDKRWRQDEAAEYAIPAMTWGEIKGRVLPNCKAKRAGRTVTSRPKVPASSAPLYSPLLPRLPFHDPPAAASLG